MFPCLFSYGECSAKYGFTTSFTALPTTIEWLERFIKGRVLYIS